MPRQQSVSTGDYWQIARGGVVKSSFPLKWDGLIVNEDELPVFSANLCSYNVHHFCLNLGSGPASLSQKTCGSRFQGEIFSEHFLFMPAGQPVEWETKKRSHALSIRIDTQVVARCAETLGINLDRLELRAAVAVYDPTVLKAMLTLRQELWTNTLNGPMHVDATTVSLVRAMLSGYSNRLVREVDTNYRLFRPELERAREYIHANWNMKIGLKDLVRETRIEISVDRFAHLFSERYGYPPHQYQIRLRIELAKDRLRYSRERLDRMGISLGFDSHSHFTRHFTRIVGMPPRLYRSGAS